MRYNFTYRSLTWKPGSALPPLVLLRSVTELRRLSDCLPLPCCNEVGLALTADPQPRPWGEHLRPVLHAGEVDENKTRFMRSRLPPWRGLSGEDGFHAVSVQIQTRWWIMFFLLHSLLRNLASNLWITSGKFRERYDVHFLLDFRKCIIHPRLAHPVILHAGEQTQDCAYQTSPLPTEPYFRQTRFLF